MCMHVQEHEAGYLFPWVSTLSIYLFVLFHVYGYFDYMYIYILCVVPTGDRKSRSHGPEITDKVVVSCHVLGIKPGSLEEQSVFLTW